MVYMLKLGPCTEEDHTRLVHAISDRDEQIARLRDAVWQVLDDMGKSGHGCCEAAKAQLRLAYGDDVPDAPLDYALEEARTVIAELDRTS